MMAMNETELLKRIATLEEKVATLQGKPIMVASKVEPKWEEPEVRITYPAPITFFVMPSAAELKQLFEIACRRLDQLGLPRDFSGRRAEEKEEDFFRQFCAAFRALGFIGRGEALDHKHAVSYWISTAEQILRELGGASETLTGLSFLTATLAHGDVLYNDVRDFPYVREFGLREYGGRPATDKWRGVLARGSTMEPVAVKSQYPSHYPMSQPSVRIVG
jgi:hypothetical protein